MIPESVIEKVAITLWHRYAPSHHIEWADEQHKEEYRGPARAALTAALAEYERLGMVMVPAEPTEAMLEAAGEIIIREYAESDWEEAKDMAEGLHPDPIYRAMLAARPKAAPDSTAPTAASPAAPPQP